MKKFAILSITLFFVFTFGQILAHPVMADSHKDNKKQKVEEKKAGRPPLKKLDGTVVNQNSQTNFYMSVGLGAQNIVWSRGAFYDEVTYTKDKQDLKSYFDINGELVGTTSIMKFSDLRGYLQKTIKKLYPDYTAGQVVSFQDNDGNATDMTLYGTQFIGQNEYFVELSKADGKLVVTCDEDGNVNLFKQL